MIVVDTNVIAALTVAGPLSALAAACFRRDAAWAAPRLWRDEFLNVLSTSVRLGALDLRAAEVAWQSAVVRLSSHEQHPDPLRTLSVATAQQITAYDAQFIVTAQALGTRLITEDKELLRKFPDLACNLKAFLAA